MRVCINNEQTGFVDFVYAESAWTGARTMLYGGVPLKKVSRTRFVFTRQEAVFLDEGVKPLYGEFRLKGNTFSGIYVESSVFREKLVIVRPLRWWEIVCMILPVLMAAAGVFVGLFLNGGTSPVLSLLCGVLGVGVGGVGMSCNSILYRIGKNGSLNAIVTVQVCLLAGLIAFLLGYAFGLI